MHDSDAAIARNGYLLSWAASSVSCLASAVASPPIIVRSAGGAVALEEVVAILV